MDKRLMSRMALPGIGPAKALGGTVARGAAPAVAEGGLNLALSAPKMTTMDPMQREMTKAAIGGHTVANAVGGAFGELVRPDGAIKRTAGGVSGSLKRYLGK